MLEQSDSATMERAPPGPSKWLPTYRVTRTWVLLAFQLLCFVDPLSGEMLFLASVRCPPVPWTKTSPKGRFSLVFGLSVIAFTETHHAR
jgi:hypothetical protein